MSVNLKRQAARQGLGLVKSGMVLGLGSGSTAAYFVRLLGEALQAGELAKILAVSTSQATAELALACGISLTTLAEHPELDLVIDGADEVDPELNLIKGLGRALLREKIIAVHTRRFVVIVDEAKLVPRLGSHAPLPVELVKFEALAHVRWLSSLGCRAELWQEDDGTPVVTENGHYLARCWFESGIADPHDLAQVLDRRPGIVEHGLFLAMATQVIVASEGGVQILERAGERA